MMFSYVFLLGRPGCGKSVAYRLLADWALKEGVADEITRIDDFPILKEITERDKNFKKHVRSEGDFLITDRSIYDDVLKEINRRIKQLQGARKIVFIEFARNSYARAFENFDREVLDRSLIVYLYCPFKICFERNIRRFREKPEGLDEHIVPRNLMGEYYRRDDYEELFLRSECELKKQAPAPIVVVKNDTEGLEGLKRELGKVTTVLRQQQSHVVN